MKDSKIVFLGGHRDILTMMTTYNLLVAEGYIVLCPNLMYHSMKEFPDYYYNTPQVKLDCFRQIEKCNLAIFLVTTEDIHTLSEFINSELNCCKTSSTPYKLICYNAYDVVKETSHRVNKIVYETFVELTGKRPKVFNRP